MHNALGLTDPLPAVAERFFGRSISVIFGERFVEALRARIEDAHVRQIPFDIGGSD
jgi:hypothetical protein